MHFDLRYVLFIDDSEEEYVLLRQAFKQAEIADRLVWCNSGEQALNLLKLERENGAGGKFPAFILLDLNKPGMGGHKTLEILKRDFASTPVIIFSTSGDDREVMRCYREGANTYVQRPLTFDALVNVLRIIKAFWLETALLPTQGGE